MRQPIQTVGELFLQVAARHKPDCILHKAGQRYVAFSSDELAEQVRSLAAALTEMGVGRGDRVGLIASNGPHWPAVDFATLSIGGILVPMDPSFLPHQFAYILNDSRCKVLLLQGREKLESILGLRDTIPSLERVVLIGDEAADDGVTTLAAEVARHRGADAATFEERVRSVRTGDLATIVYTSGTTSNPKGVMISHRNLTFVIQGAVQVMRLEPDWTVLSALSLCYLFERVQDYCYFYVGCTIAYAESVLTVVANAQEVRPHVFVTVPRILERLAARVEDAAAGSPGKQRIFAWAKAVGGDTVPYRTRARPLPAVLKLKLALADRLVLRRIRGIFGGRLQYCMSGGAPLPLGVARLLWGAGVVVYEGYGLTETSPTVSVNRAGAAKLGTVGQAFPGLEVRISEEGEILVRGPNVMMGYTAAPEEASKVVDAEGWLHTGDLGHLDAEGFLTLTGRMKHVIMNSYGDKIVPEPIEHALKESRLIQEAVVVGEGRPFYSALLVPEFEALRAWAAARGLRKSSDAELVHDPEVRELYRREVEAMNERSSYDPVDGFELLDQPFTVQGGEITVTQKVRRQAVQEKYRDLIDGIYRDQEAAVELRRRGRH